MSGRCGIFRRLVVHAAAGAVLGYGVLHPAAMWIVAEAAGGGGEEMLLASFSAAHFGMSLYFTVLGAALGGAHAFYRQAIYDRTERIRVLEGLLPICAGCKRIRDDERTERGEGEWVAVESYVGRRTGVQFSHGICPECVRKLYPEVAARMEARRAQDGAS